MRENRVPLGDCSVRATSLRHLSPPQPVARLLPSDSRSAISLGRLIGLCPSSHTRALCCRPPPVGNDPQVLMAYTADMPVAPSAMGTTSRRYEVKVCAASLASQSPWPLRRPLLGSPSPPQGLHHCTQRATCRTTMCQGARKTAPGPVACSCVYSATCLEHFSILAQACPRHLQPASARRLSHPLLSHCGSWQPWARCKHPSHGKACPSYIRLQRSHETYPEWQAQQLAPG
mmetsp:Transcript_23455/g.54181  ORF Transcript_23455/g.54181 Transcript_23455/m.54181 type:complete len:231 (+) Transcript_23455:1980-2672(+)